MPILLAWSFRSAHPGLQAGFTALEALTRHDRDTCRETAHVASYGIDKRPAELAFVNHFTTCTYCFHDPANTVQKAGTA